MNVLIVYGSRHGATGEVASAIAKRLEAFGVHAELRDAHDVGSIEAYDAIVVGSAVYMGRWVEEARGFVTANEPALRQRPTWLFSTGPVGEPLAPEDEAPEAKTLAERVGARGHRTFPGKLDRHELGLIERLTVSLVHAPDGDYRDWPAVEQWADEIAAALQSSPVSASDS